MVARRQLLAAGVVSSTIGRRVDSAHLIQLHRGVYAVGHARLTREGRWMAAVLAVGRGAVLSHRDAAALHGLRPPGDHVRTHVTTLAHAASTAAIQVHRTTVLDAHRDFAAVDGIPATSVARTLVDLAGVVKPELLAKALEQAERRNVLDAQAIEALLERTRGRHGRGHAAIRGALAQLAATGAATRCRRAAGSRCASRTARWRASRRPTRGRSPRRCGAERRPRAPASLRAMSPFWIWTQVAIVVCVVAGIVIAAVKLL